MEALELDDVPDPEAVPDPGDPAEEAEGADVGVVELDPLSEPPVEPVLLSVLDSLVLVSAGFPLFSDLLSGALSLSE